MAILALKEGLPTQKNERIYAILQNYIPYFLEKEWEGTLLLVKKQG